MSDAERLEPLILDLVEWCCRTPRSYAEVKDAWRTSWSRLPVWETAVDQGYIRRRWSPGQGATVEVTDSGRSFLDRQGRALTAPSR